MTHNEAIKAIDKAFFKLERACEHTHEWDQYLALHDKEEKEHRRFKPNHVQAGLTKAQAVRLFAVKEVFERFVPAHATGEAIFTPDAADFFHIRHSVFGAVAIVAQNWEAILKTTTKDEMREWLDKIDYAELNKDPRQQVAA